MAAPADIGLNPPKAGNVHSRTAIMTDALCKFGSVVISANTASSVEVVTTTNAGTTGVMGVVTSIGDPNNSNLFAIGDETSLRDAGDVEILVLGSTAYAETDLLITSATAGVAKKLESETGLMDVIGYPVQKVTTGTNPQRISCRLNIHRIKI